MRRERSLEEAGVSRGQHGDMGVDTGRGERTRGMRDRGREPR